LEQVETQKKNKSTEIKNQMAFSLVKKEKKNGPQKKCLEGKF
jgi:hypothetical protein